MKRDRSDDVMKRDRNDNTTTWKRNDDARRQIRNDDARSPAPGRKRAQANLPVVVVALVLLVSATGIALAAATDAREAAERDVVERSVAVSIADRLVAADGPTTRRRNVLDPERAESLTVDAVTEAVPETRDRAVRIRLRVRTDEDAGNEDAGDREVRTLVERGDVRGGTTVRRVASLAERSEASERVHVPENGTSMTTPSNATDATVRVVSGNVTTVRANARVVLHNPDGLAGVTSVDLPRHARSTLAFEGLGVLEVAIATESRSAVIVEVTVGARE
jgi:hypothetical protein